MIVRVQKHAFKPTIHSRKKLGGIKPDQVQGIEVEWGEGAVKDRPCPELRRGEARDDDP